MTVFADMERRIGAILNTLVAEGALDKDVPLTGVEVQAPRDPAHGDLATNAAMVLAKPMKRKPRDIAELIAAKLKAEPGVTKVDVAGPGFINITLEPAAWHGVVNAVFAAKDAWGRSTIGSGQRVDVEYVSANPTGPMHIGHCRGAVFGDALANLLDFAGYAVTREYYINDAGGQVEKLARSTLMRAREALGDDIGEIPDGYYPGDYLKPIGATLAATYGRALFDKPEAEQVTIAKDLAISTLLAEIKDDLAHLKVRHDVFFSEASLTTGRDKIGEAIDLLDAKGLIFQGRLPRPKGHEDDDWEDREQTLFRSTAFGDDMDRALKKSDGSYTYFAGDVGYHLDKLQREFNHYFNVLGADHVGYIPRLKAVVQALSDGKASYATPVCQLVKVLRNGEPVRMSKRAGTFVALRDVVDEVGSDPVRFMMLYRKHDSPLDFDLAKVVEQSKDNPVFYVQYAHARAASVFRNTADVFPSLTFAYASTGTVDLSRLTHPAEIDLIKQLERFPRVVEGAARDREPHRIPYYLYELASTFHHLWTMGNDAPHLRFIQKDDLAVTSARLALIAAMKLVLSSGLGVLGVHAPEEMS